MKQPSARVLRLPKSEASGFKGLQIFHLSTPGAGPFSALKIRIAPHSHFPAIYHRRMWEFFMVLRGSGYGRAGKKRVRLATGDFLFLRPGVVHDFHTGAAGLDAIVIFSPRFNPRKPDVVRA